MWIRLEKAVDCLRVTAPGSTEDLVDLLPALLTARRLEIAHSRFNIRVPKPPAPSADPRQPTDSESRRWRGICEARSLP